MKIFGFLAVVLGLVVLTDSTFINIQRQEDAEKGKDVISCTLCKTLIQTIDEMIIDPNNEQVIEDLLAGICNSLDGEIEIICDEFMSEYIDDILEMIVGGFLEPDTFCTSIGVCP